MKAQTLMVQGTTSDAGKSALVTALCRYYARRNIRVVPFKPQNMALNSAVTEDGGEIGRAQAVQAAACYLKPHTDMNPVLLKPNSDKTAQVIIHGKAYKNLDAQQYHAYKKQAQQAVLESWQRLSQCYDKVIVEGAGSPAEINLREGDIANMGFAESVDCPVILIADIDKGGVFAHLVGTLALLSESERQRVAGFVINRFRGDIDILQPGLDWLEQKTGKPVLAVLPYLQDFYLEAEDSLKQLAVSHHADVQPFNIVIPALPRISNHTDFDALRLQADVQLHFVKRADTAPAADLIILPGSKSVRDDLYWLKQQGWPAYLNRHLRYGGKVLGICGGYQMLGRQIHDPQGIEGEAGASAGLGWLDIETVLHREKCLMQRQGRLWHDGITVAGYEIHAGLSTGPDTQRAVIDYGTSQDGARSEDNQVMGCYLHGLFDQAEARQQLLAWAGYRGTTQLDLQEKREQGINMIADAVERYFDFKRLNKAIAKNAAHKKGAECAF